MNRIRFFFEDQNLLTRLVEDDDFNATIAYLNCVRDGDNSVVVSDPQEIHTMLDTEILVLTMFGQHIKRIFYANSIDIIDFLNPIDIQKKDGIRLGNIILISRTEFL